MQCFKDQSSVHCASSAQMSSQPLKTVLGQNSSGQNGIRTEWHRFNFI